MDMDMKRQIMVLFMGLALFSSCYDAMNEVPLERMPPEIPLYNDVCGINPYAFCQLRS